MMDEIKLIRIDDHLIHAQIILIWLKHMNINRIIIVDDEIASNAFLSNVYKLTTPPNIDIKILSEQMMDEYCGNYVHKDSSTRRTLLIMKHLQTAKHIFEKHVVFHEIQIGDVYLDKTSHETMVAEYKTQYQDILKFFDQKDICVYCQRVPEESAVLLNRIPRKKKIKLPFKI